MDELRGSKYRFDIVEVIQTAKQRGIKVDYSVLRSLSHSWHDIGEYFISQNVIDFITSLLENFSPKAVLDSWCNTGSLLSPLVRYFKSEKSIGITPNLSSLKIAPLLASDENILWNLGDPFSILDDINGDFDLIASAPPFGMRGKVPFAEELGLKDDVGNLLILKACQRLKKNGIGIFVVSPSFFFDKRTNTVKNSLSQHGLYLDAAFLLPHGTFEPLTSTDTYLIVVRRSKAKDFFVGQVFGDRQQDTLLLKNYHARRAGKIPQQGVLVKENEFNGLNSLIFTYELEQMVTRSGLNTLPLKTVVTAINLPRQSSSAAFTEDVNAVYLPMLGNSPSVTSMEDLSIKPQNYVQIVFDENQAFAPYVAKFFNSRVGMKFRESLSSGVVIPKITKSTLEASSIYLPNIKTQKEVSRLNADITNLSAELFSLQNELWEFPNRKIKIEGKLRRFSQEKGWELWIEELPFPMASILWAYLATVDPKEKLEHLSHFFEASIQFLATICLSAIAQDKEYYRLNQKEWNAENPKYKGWSD
jgi:SAM-dependent methyltransferase